MLYDVFICHASEDKDSFEEDVRDVLKLFKFLNNK